MRLRAGLRLVALAWRGLRSRLLLTLGSVLLAAISVMAAVVGPMYQSAASSSYLVTTLRDEPNFLTGLTFDYRPPPGPSSSNRGESYARAERSAAKIAHAAVGRDFLPPQVTLTARASGELPGHIPVRIRYFAKRDACAHLRVVGTCPSRPQQVLMLPFDLRYLHLKVGDRVRIPHFPLAPKIVGTYTVPPGQAAYWFDLDRLQSSTPAPTRQGFTPYLPAPFITAPVTFAHLPSPWIVVTADRRLDVTPATGPASLARAVREVARVTHETGRAHVSGMVSVEAGNQLRSLVRQVDERRQTARGTVTPAVVSVIVVALVLLVALLSAAMDLRASELALASLRGSRRRQLWLLGMMEPLLMIAIATPVGLVAGVFAAAGLSEVWLVPGLPVPVVAESWAAVATVVAAALLVAAGVVRASVSEPLSVQIAQVRRPRRPSRWGRLLRVALVAAAVAVLATTAAASHGSSPTATDLALPILLAAAAGLVMTAVAAGLARWWAAYSARRRGLAAFVAARTISRRRGSVLVILPLAAALGIAVFAVGVYSSAANWRASNAATIVGADSSYRTGFPLAKAVALTHRIDPGGHWLMAVGNYGDAANGPKLIVDASRLARVSAWPSSWTPGRSVGQVARSLEPGRRPVTFRGGHLAVTLDNGVHGEYRGLTLSFQVLSAAGDTKSVIIGPFRPGVSTRQVPVPFCSGGCQVQTLQLAGDAVLPERMTGSARIIRLAADGKPVPRATAIGYHPVVSTVLGPPAVTGITRGPGGVTVRLDSKRQEAIAEITPNDVPQHIPVLMGRATVDQVSARHGNDLTLDSTLGPISARVVGTAESMPILGPSGLMVDYTAFVRENFINDSDDQVHILARGDTPASVIAALRQQGITQATTIGAVQHRLGQDAYALALNLYLVVTAIVVALALAGLAANLATQLPDRRQDAASLRVIGVRRRSIRRSVVAEFVVVLGAAALAGIVSGAVSQYVVVRTVTLGYADALRTPRLLPTINLATVGEILAGMVILLLVAGVSVANLTVRGARTATLRERDR